MSSLRWPDHLLTLDEWDQLPEDVSRHFELVEGVLHMSPRPTALHQRVIRRLCQQLDAQLRPRGMEPVPEVDVVLTATFPPSLRAPDIVVTSATLIDSDPTRLDAAEVVVAIEIVSPGSARTDRIAKLADYADAGIEHYWILDIAGPVRIDIFRLANVGYQKVGEAAGGTIEIGTLDVTVDLDALVA